MRWVAFYTHGKHFHDRIISLSGEVWAHETLPHFIDVPVPSQESAQSCKCMLRVSILPLFLLFHQNIVMCHPNKFVVSLEYCHVSSKQICRFIRILSCVVQTNLSFHQNIVMCRPNKFVVSLEYCHVSSKQICCFIIILSCVVQTNLPFHQNIVMCRPNKFAVSSEGAIKNGQSIETDK